MLFVVLVQNATNGNIVVVDGPFDNSADAQEYADKVIEQFKERKENKYKTTVQVVTRPWK